MSQSPSSAGAMGIGNMLNNKGGSSGAQGQGTTPEHHTGQQQQQPQFTMDRPNSPHGSEHSRYSGPINTSYPSPTGMGAPLPVPSANMGPSPLGLPGVPQNLGHGLHPAYKTAEAPQPPPKAYPCSTCGKGFARRSDLARHGRPRARHAG
jgi:hypothetical protein